MSRAEIRRQQKSAVKAKKSEAMKKKVHPSTRMQYDDAFLQKTEEISKSLKAKTWRELETKGKFTKNDKLSFISDDMLIVGCDIGSERHYIRAVDTRGRESSEKALDFENNEEGFTTGSPWLHGWCPMGSVWYRSIRMQ